MVQCQKIQDILVAILIGQCFSQSRTCKNFNEKICNFYCNKKVININIMDYSDDHFTTKNCYLISVPTFAFFVYNLQLHPVTVKKSCCTVNVNFRFFKSIKLENKPTQSPPYNRLPKQNSLLYYSKYQSHAAESSRKKILSSYGSRGNG